MAAARSSSPTSASLALPMTFVVPKSAAALRPTWRPNNWPEKKSARERYLCAGPGAVRNLYGQARFRRESCRSFAGKRRQHPQPSVVGRERPRSHSRESDSPVPRRESYIRPPNALAISAALPGGDPLAAALAAGETPSPEMVAAAGETVGLRPRVAIGCFASFLLGSGASALLRSTTARFDKMKPRTDSGGP